MIAGGRWLPGRGGHDVFFGFLLGPATAPAQRVGGRGWHNPCGRRNRKQVEIDHSIDEAAADQRGRGIAGRAGRWG